MIMIILDRARRSATFPRSLSKDVASSRKREGGPGFALIDVRRRAPKKRGPARRLVLLLILIIVIITTSNMISITTTVIIVITI